MSLARETLINAEGWSKLDEANNTDQNQAHLDFAMTVRSTFSSKEGKKVLEAMVQQYLLNSFSSTNDASMLTRHQGQADVVKYILSQIEYANNAK